MLAWAANTFTADVACDRRERAFRAIEEALELAQACGLSQEDVDRVTERVFDREPGQIDLEIGQSAMSLAILSEVHGIDMPLAMIMEFNRVQTIPKEEFEKRHAEKVEAGIAI